MVFTAFVNIILPNDKFKAYINLCLGLVLILMVLKPLSDFLNKGITADVLFPDTKQTENMGNPDTYSEAQANMMQQSLNKQAETQLAGICANAGFTLESVDVRANADYTALQALYVTVKKIGAAGRPFIYIEPPASEESPEIKTLKNTLSEVYNMSLDNIHITEKE